MIDKDEVIHHINFELDSLTQRNGQHDFEHICRYVARAKICTNIKPATGPVQAGGDQGRDFETFPTDASVSLFWGEGADSEDLAFACSLQEKPEKGKIESDVKKILKSGKSIKRIYFFTSRNIDIAKQHTLENRVEKILHVALSILDRQAIAELLAEEETFWIASRYLRIPLELYPRPLNENEHYSKDRQKWSKIESVAGTFEEFEEIRRAGRYVYKNASLKQDILFWADKLSLFHNSDVLRELQRSSTYERTVIRYVGTGNCLGDEDLIRDYFSDFEQFVHPSNLVDAQCLLAFLHTASTNNAVDISIAEIENLVDTLIQLVDHLLLTVSDPSVKCQLLETKFSIAISIHKRGTSPNEAIDKMNSSIIELERILDLLPQSPLFPLESLVNNLRKWIAMFIDFELDVDVSRLEKIAGRLDEEFLAKRYGGFKAAESSMDRAIVYFEKERFLECIALFHRAKILWFADETLKGSILSIFLIASCYKRLGLNYAAKYYDLAAAHIAATCNKRDLFIYLSKGLFSVADSDYATGAWVRFLSSMELALLARQEATTDYPDDDSDELPSLVYYPAVVKYIAERFNLGIQDQIAERLQRLPSVTQEDVAEMSKKLEETWRDLSNENLKQILSEQIHGQPYSDLGQEREVAWKAYGIFWKARFANDYETTMVAEQLIAILQILHAELAMEDFHNLKGEARLEIKIEQGLLEPDLSRVGSNQFASWIVKLPCPNPTNWKKQDDSNSRYLGIVMQMLADFSMLTAERFLEKIHNQFEEDLSNKLWVANRYEVLFHAYVPKSTFDEDKLIPPPPRPFEMDPEEPSLLSWKDSLSPFYSVEKSHTQIRNRYRNAVKSIRLTMEKYRDNPIFISFIRILRSNGWLDWHILLAMMNRAANFRYDLDTKATTSTPSFEEMKRVTLQLIETEETSDSIEIPLVEFSPQSLEMYLNNLGPVTAASTWGLEQPMQTPNFETVREFMSKRFNYMTDDVEHEQLLPAT